MLVQPAELPALFTPLTRDWFDWPTPEVARALLGAYLVRRSAEGVSAGRIVETEAYGPSMDLASHTRAGRTRRTAPMFGAVGHAYVYLVYGMHECLNVVARDATRAEAGAVLLRALEPTVGVDQMRLRRANPADPDSRLAAGPARLCQALAVDRSFSGHDLTVADRLWVALRANEAPVDDADVAVGTRIGVQYAGGEWSSKPWRYWLRDNPSVSRR
ncbi:MAG: DNA-3-methyladenine glycosylase [Chloroflexota bacterium]|nr:DNA-3-methyladenine glycosylase [Chloroflexota bacterium]